MRESRRSFLRSAAAAVLLAVAPVLGARDKLLIDKGVGTVVGVDLAAGPDRTCWFVTGTPAGRVRDLAPIQEAFNRERSRMLSMWDVGPIDASIRRDIPAAMRREWVSHGDERRLFALKWEQEPNEGLA